MDDEQIKQMVSRFLGWKLPQDFSPDAGISFKPDFNENTPSPMKHEPTGTNLFSAAQAEAMVRHMVEGMRDDAPFLRKRLEDIDNQRHKAIDEKVRLNLLLDEYRSQNSKRIETLEEQVADINRFLVR